MSDHDHVYGEDLGAPGHFNRMTPPEAERLAILAEEAGEVVQACGKILRHGYSSFHPQTRIGNRTALEKEIGDFIGIARALVEAGDVDGDRIEEAAAKKVANASRFTHHQKWSA